MRRHKRTVCIKILSLSAPSAPSLSLCVSLSLRLPARGPVRPRWMDGWMHRVARRWIGRITDRPRLDATTRDAIDRAGKRDEFNEYKPSDASDDEDHHHSRRPPTSRSDAIRARATNRFPGGKEGGNADIRFMTKRFGLLCRTLLGSYGIWCDLNDDIESCGAKKKLDSV